MLDLNKNGLWVIGDVHGEYDTLIELINELPKDANICFTGDLVDRGKQSAKVVEYVIKNNYLCILGNHELMMIKSTKDTTENYMWKSNGGKNTLKSYWHFSNDEWNSHIKYLESLPYFLYFEIDGYKPLVVSHSYIHHVWINKEHQYCEYDGEDILWKHMFDKKLFEKDKEIENGIFNIFGHTPIKEPIVTDSYAMIDTGASYDKDGYRKLSAIHYPSLVTFSKEVYFKKRCVTHKRNYTRKLDKFKPEIEALLANGSTQKFIANRYNTTEANFYNWFLKHGLKTKK